MSRQPAQSASDQYVRRDVDEPRWQMPRVLAAVAKIPMQYEEPRWSGHVMVRKALQLALRPCMLYIVYVRVLASSTGIVRPRPAPLLGQVPDLVLN